MEHVEDVEEVMAQEAYTKEYVEYLLARIEALVAEVKQLTQFRDDIIQACREPEDENHP